MLLEYASLILIGKNLDANILIDKIANNIDKSLENIYIIIKQYQKRQHIELIPLELIFISGHISLLNEMYSEEKLCILDGIINVNKD